MAGVIYTIVGVMPSGFQFPGKSEIWLPWQMRNGIPRDRRGGHWLSALAGLRLASRWSRPQAEMNIIQGAV